MSHVTVLNMHLFISTPDHGSVQAWGPGVTVVRRDWAMVARGGGARYLHSAWTQGSGSNLCAQHNGDEPP